ncbi:Ger(x)C family spore germination protein [Bacillus songklensis]|uniref:Ger(X)C family spore germination protein n=1 Tax=Bacillus songklensis TaxID=1069116 RepID=A0ABV8B8G0_9BACI
MKTLKKHLLACCLANLFCLSGCWDLVELTELTVVGGVAVGRGEEAKYKLTLEVINAAELGPKKTGNSTPGVVYSMEGDDISEMFKKFNIVLSRKLILSHLQIIVISEELAEEGIDEFLDFLVRDREIRNDFNIVIAKGNKAKDILSVTYPFQKVSSLKLNTQLDTLKKDYGGDPGVRLKDFSDAVSSKGKEAILEMMEVKGDPEKGKELTNMQTEMPDALVEAVGAGIFLGDRLVGQFSIEDIRNYSIIANQLRATNYTIPCSENGVLGVRVYQAKTDVKTTYRGDRPVIDMEILLESYLESSSCKSDLDSISTYRKYDKKISDYIEEQIFQTIQKAQEKESDVFGFGEKMAIQRPRTFKKIENEWPKEFAKAEIKVNVKAKLRRAGLEKKSFEDPYEH